MVIFAAGVFVDLQKAFDTVNHEILFKKLQHYGIRGTLIKWFTSYLSNRQQHVSVMGFDSKNQNVNHGVPQGSVLGPLFFPIYVNDIHRSIKRSSTYHFADDTNLLTIAKNPKKLQSILNKDLNSLYKWLLANKISLNAAKTEMIIFRKPRQQAPLIKVKINGTRVIPSSKIKYLGIYLDIFLNGSAHCYELQTKLQRATGMIAKTRHYLKENKSQLISLYHSIFSCHIVYGCQIWSLNENRYTKKIQTLQNRAVRLISFSELNPDLHTIDHYKKLKLLKISDLVTLKNLLFVHDYFNNQLPNCFDEYFTLEKDIHQQNTRNSSKTNKLHVPNTVQVTYGDHSFKSRVVVAWNDLCNVIPNVKFQTLKKEKFKNLVINHILDGYT